MNMIWHHENYYGTSRKLMNDKNSKRKNNSKRYRSKRNRKPSKIIKRRHKIVTIFLKSR